MKVLKQNGWDVTIVCDMSPEFISEYKGEFELINIPFHRGISFKDTLFMPFRLAKLFKKGKFDIVQYATPNASLYSSIGARLAGITNRVYCQWGIRYVGSEGVMRGILRLLEKFTCMNSTAIRPASRKNMEFAVAENLYAPYKAKVIGDGGTVGIDLHQFDINMKERFQQEVYLEFPQLKDKKVFAFVGRLNIDKGIFDLLQAFQELQQKHAATALLLIGNFDGNLPTHLQGGMGNANIISTGWIDNVPKYLSVADVLVHPSYREGFSMVIQQAMALAIPVITTDIPGPSEVIEDGISGILIEPKNPKNLLEAMEWTYTHPNDCELMGKSGRRRCEEYFSRERMLELTLKDRENLIKAT